MRRAMSFSWLIEQARNSDSGVPRGARSASMTILPARKRGAHERRLKDRVRAQLGLKPLAEIKEMTLDW